MLCTYSTYLSGPSIGSGLGSDGQIPITAHAVELGTASTSWGYTIKVER